MVGGVALCSLFGLMLALGQNIATVLIGRFFSGFFGVAAIAVLGGIISDCWNEVDRGTAMALCISICFSGPTLGPVIGGFIASSSISWRWTMWIVVISTAIVSAVGLLTFTETYPPRVLQKKAKKLRRKTGNPDIQCFLDQESISLAYVAQVYLIRPWRKHQSHPIATSPD